MTFIFNNFNNLINILFSQMVCFCFNHYSDYRFCSTLADKDTSLITVIGGKEMTYAAKAVIAKTYQGLFPLFGIALMYLLLVMLFSKLLGVLERRLRQSDRR